jgi:hypothetical protein
MRFPLLLVVTIFTLQASSKLIVTSPSNLSVSEIPAFPTIACATREQRGATPDYDFTFENVTLIHPNFYLVQLYDPDLDWSPPPGVENPAIVIRFDYLTPQEANSTRVVKLFSMVTAARLAQEKGYKLVIAIRFGDFSYLGHQLYMANTEYACPIPMIALASNYLPILSQIDTFDLTSYDANPNESFRKSPLHIILVTVPAMLICAALLVESVRRLYRLGFPYVINAATHLLCVNFAFSIMACKHFYQFVSQIR